MDSVDCRKQNTEAILGLLKSGTLSVQEMHEKIGLLIDTELSKGSEYADPALIDACEVLLHGLGCGKQTVKSHRDQNLHTLLSRLNKKHVMSSFISRTLRIATITAVVFVLLVVGEHITHRQWLESTQSQDQQQFIIQGKSVDPELVNKGNAAPDDSFVVLETQDYQEAIILLGFEPPLPAWLPDGWDAESYFVERFMGSTKIIVVYEKVGEEFNLTYEIARYSDVAHANDEFEQDAEGRIAKIINGHSVYLSTNLDRGIAVWLKGVQCSSLSGPLSEQELLEIIMSIKE